MIKPVGRRVLLKQKKVGEVTKGGIILTDDVVRGEQLSQITAEVVDIGNIAWDDCGDGSPWCKIGDKVFFAQYSGQRINKDYTEDEEYDYLLVNDLDITGVVE